MDNPTPANLDPNTFEQTVQQCIQSAYDAGLNGNTPLYATMANESILAAHTEALQAAKQYELEQVKRWLEELVAFPNSLDSTKQTLTSQIEVRIAWVTSQLRALEQPTQEDSK